MTNWNQVPREEVEAAALAGDVEAQDALRIHHTLDRMADTITGMREDIDRSTREHTAQLDEIRDLIRGRVPYVRPEPKRTITCWRCGQDAARGENCAHCQAYNSEGK